MLRDYVEKVLIEYNDVRNKENFSDNPLAKVLRNEFPNYLKELTDIPGNYKFYGSAGQGNWTYSPWVAVFNKKITESAQKGYYIVYLFCEDMKGVYLSLNQGMTDIKKQTSSNSQTKDLLSSRAEDFRNQLKDSLSSELLEKIDLEIENSPNAPFYEAGNIYAKYYSLENLPSEESLEADFKEFLRLYDLLVDKRNILEIIQNPQEIKEALDKFLEIMYNYADEVIATEKFDLGPKMRVEVHWSNDLRIYMVNRELDFNRYMNAFGIQKPDVNINLSVVCEINIPKDGINKNVQGAFAKDLKENVYLIHRGNIGGKHPKAEFFDKYTGETAQIQEGNTVTDVILIGYLNPKLPEKVKNFVFEVAKIKGPNNDISPKPLQNTGYNVINSLFIEYKETFLNTQMGKDHLLAYELYCKDVNKHFNTIMNDPEIVNDTSDSIINYLLPIKGKPIAPAAVGDIKAYGYTAEDIPLLTKTVFKLVDDLNNTNDKIQQKKLIVEFKNGPFKKGFQTAMISPVLYCINKQYWLYNNKTVQTFKLLSEILEENDKIDGILENYIDNLDKLTNLVEDISIYIPEFSDFKVFDAFCHWMCDPKLGYYAMDPTKYAEWLKINFPEELKIDNTPRTFAEFLVDEGYYFEPEMIENFLLSFKAKRFVILTGNSGTGKTKIAQLFAQYISNSMVKNSSINTKVKVGKATKNKGWTLKKDVLKDFGITNINGSYDIKIDGVKGKGNLYMLSQLFYVKDNEIQSKLKDLEINDPDQEIDLEIILPSNEGFQYKIVPVGANWTENRHIIGFYNVITNKYITSEALELILEASKPENKDKPFYLILDEMNLSHVERYFSDFLSAMESDEYISLHKSNDKIGYPTDIKIPKNLFVIGTVNVDETTYMFSPKVLDRANVIEFSTISAKDYMLNGVTQDQLTGNVNYLENPLYEHNLVKSLSESRIENFRSYLENIETIEGNKLWDLLSDELNIFQEVLKTAGFDFGFRVIDEILRFMYVAWYYEGENEIWDNWQRYFDAQIKQKMLPRIHGSQRVLENTLNELSQLCVDYPTSKAKIEEMEDVLYKQRYVSFTN